MVTTTIVNESGHPLELREGNCGVWSRVTIIRAGGTFSVRVNPNATYREYWFSVPSHTGEPKLIITSDDMVEYESVRVKMRNDDSNLEWVGTKSRSQLSSFRLPSRGFLSKFLELFHPRSYKSPV